MANSGDGACRIFLNTKGEIGGRKELQDMLKYIEKSTYNNAVNPALENIHNLVTSVKQSKKAGARYMWAIEHDMKMKEVGREEGREEGIEALILDNIEENVPKERILQKLQKRFSLSEENANEQYKKYTSKTVN